VATSLVPGLPWGVGSAYFCTSGAYGVSYTKVNRWCQNIYKLYSNKFN